MKKLTAVLVISSLCELSYGLEQQKFTCEAQCIRLHQHDLDLGEHVEGISYYSKNEAFTDMALKCPAPGVLVKSLAHSYQKKDEENSFSVRNISHTKFKTYSKSSTSLTFTTEENSDYQIDFFKTQDCTQVLPGKDVNPQGGRKFAGKKKIQG